MIFRCGTKIPTDCSKNTQSVMAGEWLSKGLDKEIASYGYYRKEFYVYDKKEMPKKVTYSIDESPRDVTFIYALTTQQNESISRPGGANFFMSDGWSERRAYYEAGAGDIGMSALTEQSGAPLLAVWPTS